MEPEDVQKRQAEANAAAPLSRFAEAARESNAGVPFSRSPQEEMVRDSAWVLLGDQGLRAGWSVLMFSVLTVLLFVVLGKAVFSQSFVDVERFSVTSALLNVITEVVALTGAGLLVARMEQRRFTDFNLGGQRRVPHFFSGLAAGFLALSALVGALTWGGWLRFGPVALSGARVLEYAAGWGVVFLLTGLAEEGAFRCYLQFTLTRGINFWWALAAQTALCLCCWLETKGSGPRGVYLVALLGLLPCLHLHVKRRAGAGFWQAAWVTSALFAGIHLSNGGENWIGIFAAGAIGFVFCVSVRLTGSAWWAIGCHAAWDWAETYFYGTADSGLVAHGHLLTTQPQGNALWSGGADGPEGSLLAIGVVALLLLALMASYGRNRTAEMPDHASANA